MKNETDSYIILHLTFGQSIADGCVYLIMIIFASLDPVSLYSSDPTTKATPNIIVTV